MRRRGLSIWQIARTRLSRVEARRALGRRTRILCLALAAVLALVVLVPLIALLVPGGEANEVLLIAVLYGTSSVLNLGCLVLAIGGPAQSFTDERDRGTLESLMLTPMDRREIVWAKFWGRTAPLRFFFKIGLPSCVAAGLLLGVVMVAGQFGPEPGPGASYELVALLLGGGAALLLVFALQLFVCHCVAALAIYISARSKTTGSALLRAYGLLLAGVLCGGLPGTVVICILGPMLLGQLIKNLDNHLLLD